MRQAGHGSHDGAVPFGQLVERRVGGDAEHVEADQQPGVGHRARGVHAADHEVDVGEYRVRPGAREREQHLADPGLDALRLRRRDAQRRVVARRRVDRRGQLPGVADAQALELAQAGRSLRQVFACEDRGARLDVGRFLRQLPCVPEARHIFEHEPRGRGVAVRAAPGLSAGGQGDTEHEQGEQAAWHGGTPGVGLPWMRQALQGLEVTCGSVWRNHA